MVGTFTTTDPDTGQSFTYTLVVGSGDTDKAWRIEQGAFVGGSLQRTCLATSSFALNATTPTSCSA
jgi:hypothetical protein